MNRPGRGAAALVFLLIAGNELWAQRPLGGLRSQDFHAFLLREVELQRRTPTPLFREIDPVFVLNEAAISRMVYDPVTGVLRWRYRVRPGVGRVVAAGVARRLQNFVLNNLIRAGMVTQAQVDAGQFRVEVLADEVAPEEVFPPGVPETGRIEGGGAPPPPRQQAENAPQTVVTTGSVGYAYYGWYCGWGYPWCWGWGYPCCGWGWGCYYGYPWWGCGYYPVAYPTAVVSYPAASYVVASSTPVQTAPTTSLARTTGQGQLADARLSRISLYPSVASEEARQERSSPTFWRQPTGADPDGLFWDGYTLYWQGSYRNALDSFEAALAERRDDARFWYYKALCEKALGQRRAADASAGYARKLRVRGLPALDQIGSVLERVQGPDRRFLNGEVDALASR